MIISHGIFRRFNGVQSKGVKGISEGRPCSKCGGPRKFGEPCRPCLRKKANAYMAKHRFMMKRDLTLRNGKTADECVGKKHGMLTALSVVHIEGKHGRYLQCRCDCGKIKVVSFQNLGTITKSCGCLVSIRRKQTTLPFGEAARRAVVHRYQYMAKKTGRTFLLSDDDCTRIFKSNCCYCGSPPSGKVQGKSYNGHYVYNGIDRVDNASGYEPGNVVPCCEICNRLKGSLSPENWDLLQQHFEKIVRHRASKLQMAA